MSRDFPDWIDPDRAAQGERTYSGRVPVTWLKRLEDLLDAPERDDGWVDFSLRVWQDDQGHPRLELQLDGQVPLTCQRTLERYLQPIAGCSDLTVVESEAELSVLPDDAEPKVCPGGRLRVVELIEDEVLLLLPVVPVKPGTEPVETRVGEIRAPDDEDDKASSPFAALEELKKR